ncbi:hypothetical protein COTS27_00415 [Spirochaetota bacterium]|nr:hypothetical protein COTS27_00415 [Spirochaetota bacterium]
MEAYLALLLFVCILVMTPGPANLLLLVVGSQYGMRNCIPFISGLIVGKLVLNLTVGMGIGTVGAQYPHLNLLMKIASGGFIVYLAFRSWNGRMGRVGESKQSENKQDKKSYFSFLSGVVVHPLNPKAWAMVTLAWSNFGPSLGTLRTQTVLIVLTFAIVQGIFHTVWAGAGAVLRYQFNEHTLIISRIFITATVGIVVGSLIIL